MATFVSTPQQRAHPLRQLGVWHLLSRWHLLSLDAPCVAALWTAFFAWQFHVSLGATAVWALWLAVWMLYASDRIYDAMRGQAEAERHRFHLRYRIRFGFAATMAATLLCLVLVHVPARLRLAWMALGVPLLLYVCAVHVLALRRVPKEPLVGVFFAFATAMPLLVAKQPVHGPVLLSACSFGSVCWLNCIAIARWERTLSHTDPITAWLGERLAFPAGLAVVPAAFLMCTHDAPAGCCIVAATALLLVLDRVRLRFSPVAVRALADAALLTPLLIWPVAAWIRPK